MKQGALPKWSYNFDRNPSSDSAGTQILILKLSSSCNIGKRITTDLEIINNCLALVLCSFNQGMEDKG